MKYHTFIMLAYFLTIVIVVGIAALAWITTRSLWSFLLLLPVVWGFKVEGGNGD